jgi:aldose 1-epimerase
MAPWCNRLDCQPLTVAGRVVALTPNFPDGTAIHGQVYALPWQHAGPDRLRVLAGGDAWPWRYQATMHIAASDRTIVLSYELTNVDDVPMPAGIGIHPWFAKPVQVGIPARRVYPVNAATEPDPEPISGRYDLRTAMAMPDDLDATWADLTENVIRLRWPRPGITVTFAFDATQSCVVAASPADVDAVAVEPQTHAPGGLRRLREHQSLPMALLEPGASLTIRYLLGC